MGARRSAAPSRDKILQGVIDTTGAGKADHNLPSVSPLHSTVLLIARSGNSFKNGGEENRRLDYNAESHSRKKSVRV